MTAPRKFPLLMISLTCLGLPLAAQEAGGFPATTLRVVVVDQNRRTPIAGNVSLSADAVSFESSEVVFTLLTKEIKSVEFKGVRDGFLTFVLDEKSGFIGSYPFLLLKRNDSYNQPVAIFPISLDSRERVDSAVRVAKAFQTLIAAQNAAAAKSMVGSVNVSAEDQAIHPFLGKTLRVVVQEVGEIGEILAVTHGLLTFFPDHLELNSREVNFAIPHSSIEQVECAGARDTFLRVQIDPHDKFNALYKHYLAYPRGNRPPSVRFILDAPEEVAPSYKIALDFQKLMGEVIARRNQAMVGSVGSSAEMAQPASAGVAANNAHKSELGRFGAGFLEHHNPSNALNGWKAILGIPGSLIVFDSGFGYVSNAQEPKVKPARRQFFKDGYLKFFVPNEAIAGARNVSVIRNRTGDDSANSYIVEIAILQDSDFYRQHRQLMAESNQDNVLFLRLKDKPELERCLKILRPVSRKNEF